MVRLMRGREGKGSSAERKDEEMNGRTTKGVNWVDDGTNRLLEGGVE